MVLQDWTILPDPGRRAGGATVVGGGSQMRSYCEEAPPRPNHNQSGGVYVYQHTHGLYLSSSKSIIGCRRSCEFGLVAPIGQGDGGGTCRKPLSSDERGYRPNPDGATLCPISPNHYGSRVSKQC